MLNHSLNLQPGNADSQYRQLDPGPFRSSQGLQACYSATQHHTHSDALPDVLACSGHHLLQATLTKLLTFHKQRLVQRSQSESALLQQTSGFTQDAEDNSPDATTRHSPHGHGLRDVSYG
jgi:hypothetical protein